MGKNTAIIDRHVGQWTHNWSLIGLLPASHLDWIVTTAFYTAVHAVDAALAFEGVSAWNHDTRFIAIGGVNRLLKVRELYHTLYNLSRTVRYSADHRQWVPLAEIEPKVIRGCLLPLENSFQVLIGRDLSLPMIDLAHLSAKPVVPAD